MTTFTYSTELDLRGPWLLETEAFERLHQIVEPAWSAYQETRQILIEQKVESRLEEAKARYGTVDDMIINEVRASAIHQFSSGKRFVRVDLEDSKSITTDTISQAIKPRRSPKTGH